MEVNTARIGEVSTLASLTGTARMPPWTIAPPPRRRANHQVRHARGHAASHGAILHGPPTFFPRAPSCLRLRVCVAGPAVPEYSRGGHCTVEARAEHPRTVCCTFVPTLNSSPLTPSFVPTPARSVARTLHWHWRWQRRRAPAPPVHPRACIQPLQSLGVGGVTAP